MLDEMFQQDFKICKFQKNGKFRSGSLEHFIKHMHFCINESYYFLLLAEI